MDSKLVHNVEDLEKLFSSRMREYEDKLLRATAGNDPTHADLTSLSKDFTKFKSFVCQALTHVKSQIVLLSLSVDSHETAMRRKVLLFHGIPENNSEKLSASIHQIIEEKLKVDNFKLEYLKVCHRLGAPQGRTRPVVVRFGDMEHRRLVWDSKTSLKGSGITISEFLTKTRHQAFTAARKHFGISNCWSAEGKVIVLTPDKSRRKIASLGELENIIALFPATAGADTSLDPVPAVSKSPAVAVTLPTTATPKTKVARKARR